METSLIGRLHMAAAFRQLMLVNRSVGHVDPAPQPLGLFQQTAMFATVLPRFPMSSGCSGMGWCKQHGTPEGRNP
ncbi:MAG: hypothetical protein M3O20_02455 [Acidobacteriota bacterium]|nr:hypothetical protein [Acidobacteriota bacterium]